MAAARSPCRAYCRVLGTMSLIGSRRRESRIVQRDPCRQPLRGVTVGQGS